MEKLQKEMVNLQNKYGISDDDMQSLANAISEAFEGASEGEPEGE